MTIIHKIKIDLMRQDIYPPVSVVQGDTYSREVAISLYSGGSPWELPNGHDIAIRYSKPDGTTGIYDTLPDDSVAWSTDGNTVSVVLCPQMLTCPGKVSAQVIIIVGERILATFPFTVAVAPDPSAGTVRSEPYYNWRNAFLPQTKDAQVGQFLQISKVDASGRIIEVVAVENPAGTVASNAADALRIAQEVAQEMKDYSPSGTRSIAEAAMRTASSRLVAPQSASAGQYFRVKEVDENGFVTEVEAVDPPTGGGYGGGDLDMAGSVIDNVGSLSFSPVDDGYSQAFWIQSANDIKNDDGSHTAVAEFFSSESDGPVVLRNIADGEKDNEAVNLSQLKTRLPAPLTASVGQYIQITAIDENGLVTAVKAVDAPAGGGSGGDGATFFPSVCDDGTLSWTNDKELPNPEPVNIKGEPGNSGVYVGTEPPTDPNVNVWINPDEDPDTYVKSVNGVTPDENGNVNIPTTPGASGTSAEKAAELQLAAGVIAAETAANTKINTGVSLALLKKYRRFVFVLKGATNQGLSNLYLHFGTGRKIGRSDSAGGLVYMYEWVNREESLLKATAVFQGNPSLVRAIGSSYVVNSMPASWGNGSEGSTGVHIFNLSSAADDVTLILENGSKATIDYNWEIRGLTI